MKTRKLKSLLKEAKDKFSEIPEEEKTKQLSWPGELPGDLSKIHNELRKTPELKIFDDKMRVLENSRHLIDYIGLAKWLIYRALKVGVGKTIEDLKSYLNSSKFEYYQIEALSGIRIEDELQLNNGIKLVPFSSIPDSVHKSMLEDGYHFGALARPTVALIRKNFHKRIHISSEGSSNNISTKTNWEEEFNDALLCLTLIGRIGISSLTSWLTIDDAVPLSNFQVGAGAFPLHIFGVIHAEKVDITD